MRPSSRSTLVPGTPVASANRRPEPSLRAERSIRSIGSPRRRGRRSRPRPWRPRRSSSPTRPTRSRSRSTARACPNAMRRRRLPRCRRPCRCLDGGGCSSPSAPTGRGSGITAMRPIVSRSFGAGSRPSHRSCWASSVCSSRRSWSCSSRACSRAVATTRASRAERHPVPARQPVREPRRIRPPRLSPPRPPRRSRRRGSGPTA